MVSYVVSLLLCAWLTCYGPCVGVLFQLWCCPLDTHLRKKERQYRPSQRYSPMTFPDAMQTLLGSCTESDVAGRVATRVLAHYPLRNQMIVDAGFLALSHDKGRIPQLSIPHGGICVVQGHPELRSVCVIVCACACRGSAGGSSRNSCRNYHVSPTQQGSEK